MFELLAYIDMGGNSTRVFNAIILRYMPKFSNLWLYSNELTSIDDFRIYYKMKIYLVGNPWHCETALSRTPVRARQAPGVWDRFIPA